MAYRLGTDVGGTFTDLVLLDEDTGEISVFKTPSTPRNPADGVFDGIKNFEEKTGQIAYFTHGTTVGTNAVLERKGAKTALITTKGFRDVIEIGRQSRGWPKPKIYDFFIDKPDPLVSRNLRFEVDERIDHKGDIVKSIDAEEIKQLSLALKEADIKCIAICFLFSYANNEHELEVKDIISEALPNIFISTSSEVLPEYREYERFSTTVLNSYVQPLVSGYLEDLKTRSEKAGILAAIHIMQSNGGLMTIEAAKEKSVHILLSGPAGGVDSAVFYGSISGYENIIAFDMGGTSADISLIEKGSPKLTSEGYIGGYPAKIPMIEINTIGAGGGSIAWIDTGGALKVGPQSAGAAPGPACYDKGGKEPTVTDANVVLGYINPDYFLGGKMKVDKDKAFSSVLQIGKKLGLDPLIAAYGITEIVNSNMIRAIRIISVERGYDPRDFVLVAFGGAGPLHACRLAAELNIPKVLIPPAPGISSAIGLLVADIKHDYSITRIQEMDKFLPSDINKIWAEIEEKAISRLKKEGVSSQSIMLHRSIDMRYKGQSFEITVPVPGGEITDNVINEITRAFDNTHDRLYGYSCDDPIEGVIFRVSAIGKTPKIRPKRLIKEGGLDGALKYRRKAFFKKYDDYIETPVYERDLLSPGNILKGPAIVEQMDSTTVIHPGQVGIVDDYCNIIIEIRED